VNRVCEEKFSLFHPIELGLFIAIGYGLLDGQKYVPEYYLVMVYLALAIGQYLHFALTVIKQMTTYLNIRCLHIPVKKQE